MTVPDHLRAKAEKQRLFAYGMTGEARARRLNASLLDLLADYVEAMDDAGCDTRYDRKQHRLVHSDTCSRCALLSRIEEVAK